MTTWLDSCPPMCGREAVAIAAAVASAIDELHHRGLVHGALGPDRIVVDDSGAVSLMPADELSTADLGPADDVAALGSLFLWLAERAPDRARPRRRSHLLRMPDGAELLLELGQRCRTADPLDRPSARVVADTLHRRVAAPAKLLGAPWGMDANRGRRRATLGSVVAVGLVGGVVAPARCAPTSADAPVVRPSDNAATWADGTLTVGTARYAVGAPGDHVLVERWACGRPSVALLRRPLGEVVAFDRFPSPDAHAVGRVLARLPDARRLVGRRTPDGCPALAVVTADGRTVPVPWKETP